MAQEFRKLGIYLAVFGLVLASSCSSGQKNGKRGSKEERAALLVDAAQGALMEKDPIGALQYLKAAEDLAPKLTSIYHMRALAFQARKMPEEALLEMKKAVDLDPKNSYSNNTYGKFLMDAGRLDEAEGFLTKAAEDTTFRESYKSRTSLGILQYRKNLLDLAEKNFTLAVNDDPANSCIAYYYKGHILAKNSKLTEASQMYEKASSKLCAAFVDAHYALGLAYEKTRRYDLARKKYLDISQNFPESTYSEQAMQKLKKIP
jgi:Tfp pilus assembly protein PilF